MRLAVGACCAGSCCVARLGLSAACVALHLAICSLEALGSQLRASRLPLCQPAPSTLLPLPQTKFREDHHCAIVCRLESLNKKEEKAFKSKIADEYRVNM